MRFITTRFGLLPALLEVASAANIFVSHYQGTVSSLTLTEKSGGDYSLVANGSVNIGGQPSFMTYDSKSRIIYVSDETGYGSASMTSVLAAENGGLTRSGRSTAALGSVANNLYGTNYLASACYQTSMVQTFKLPLTSSSPIQTLTLTMSGHGPNSRQDAPHPHGIFVDPTGAFILVPDLGADLIRIHSIDNSTGKLTNCGNYVETPGTGPRHGAFWGKNTFFVANELANSVHRFTYTYPASGCMSFTKEQVLTTMAGNRTAPSGTKVGEVHVKDNFLYLSNRRDLSFTPNDSMATFSLDADGVMTFQGLISSGGTYPRTFAINNAGDLMVIGDQTTANVAVVKRDPTTGALGPQIASMRIGTVGTAESDNGLSDVLWDE